MQIGQSNINRFVEAMYHEVKAEKPSVRVGISPFGIWRPRVPPTIEAQLDAYGQLYADARQRFSVVSFVWGPGQQTPVHDHTVWGLVAVLRGAEVARSYAHNDHGALVTSGEDQLLERGTVAAVSPSIGDIHRVSNAFDDRVSISIHVYGANIGGISRHVYPPDGPPKPLVSGYTNDTLPNLWNLSKERLDS